MTTVTKTFRRGAYEAIDPSSSLNSQSGKTILITGGGSGIGHSIARSFVTASAARVIIVGRREDMLSRAAAKLESSKTSESKTAIIPLTCDISDSSSVQALWTKLKEDGIAVEVLVLNAAYTDHARQKTSDKTADRIWRHFETNVLGNLRMMETFCAQGPEKGKFLISISTAGVHLNPVMDDSEAYVMSKASLTYALQALAGASYTDPEVCQIISCHPGRIFTETAAASGYTRDTLPWDDENLPAAFCVWAATKQASFLHGRYVWTNWDVKELRDMKERFEDPGFLKIGLQGIKSVTPIEMMY